MLWSADRAGIAIEVCLFVRKHGNFIVDGSFVKIKRLSGVLGRVGGGGEVLVISTKDLGHTRTGFLVITDGSHVSSGCAGKHSAVRKATNSWEPFVRTRDMFVMTAAFARPRTIS